jgi:hypothetical protein
MTKPAHSHKTSDANRQPSPKRSVPSKAAWRFRFPPHSKGLPPRRSALHFQTSSHTCSTFAPKVPLLLILLLPLQSRPTPRNTPNQTHLSQSTPFNQNRTFHLPVLPCNTCPSLCFLCFLCFLLFKTPTTTLRVPSNQIAPDQTKSNLCPPVPRKRTGGPEFVRSFSRQNPEFFPV